MRVRNNNINLMYVINIMRIIALEMLYYAQADECFQIVDIIVLIWIQLYIGPEKRSGGYICKKIEVSQRANI